MPGIAGLITQQPLPHCQEYATLMVRAMMHEPFYVSGAHFVPEMGIYAGLVAHEKLFAGDQVFSNEDGRISLLLAGECFLEPAIRIRLRARGHILQGESDWLVHFYEEEGDQFFE